MLMSGWIVQVTPFDWLKHQRLMNVYLKWHRSTLQLTKCLTIQCAVEYTYCWYIVELLSWLLQQHLSVITVLSQISYAGYIKYGTVLGCMQLVMQESIFHIKFWYFTVKSNELVHERHYFTSPEKYCTTKKM